MMAQPLQCRWGVIGTGRTATRLITDIQAAEKAKSSALPIQHSITAIAAAANDDADVEALAASKSFAQQFFGNNVKTTTPTVTASSTPRTATSTPASIAFPNSAISNRASTSAAGSTSASSSSTAPVLLNSPSDLFALSNVVDVVVVDSSPDRHFAHASAALAAGIAVLLFRPQSLSAVEAKELMDIAKSKKVWLAIMMKESKRDKTSLRWIADECARCRERSIAESSQAPWDDTLALLETLDEIRQSNKFASSAPCAPVAPAIPQISVAQEPKGIPNGTPNNKGIGSFLETSDVNADQATSNGIEAEPPPPAAADTAHNETDARNEPFPASTAADGEHGADEIDLAPRRFPRTPRPSGQLPDLAETPEDSTANQSLQSLSQEESISEQRARRRAGSRPASRMSVGSETSVSMAQDSPILAKKPLDDASANASGSAGGSGAASLRSQIHELKHLLRQKNAQIAALQGGTSDNGGSTSTAPLSLSTGGNAKKSAVRISMPVQGFGAAPRRPPRRRTSSISSDVSRGGTSPNPLGEADINGRFASPEPSSLDGESRGETPPLSRGAAQAGFLAPTKASEQRRAATLTQQAQGIAHRTVSNASASEGSGGSTSGGHTGQVISHLTSELAAARSALDATKAKLATTQRNLASVTKSYESARDNLYHSRIDNDRQVTASARKDRQYAEVLERARKAETEAKELGRSSREWGTRVRQVESELGDVRRQQAKADAGYEAITSAWKRTREHWEAEVRGLRKQLEDVITEHREKARSALAKFEVVEHEWKGREGERKGLEAVLEGLKQERAKARVEVVKMVDDLVARLEQHEKARTSQESRVQEVHGELTRILRLMRDGVQDPEQIRAAGSAR